MKTKSTVPLPPKETKRLSQINSEVDKKNKERKEAIDKTQARIDEFMQKTIQNIDRQRKQIKWSDDIENLNATKKRILNGMVIT